MAKKITPTIGKYDSREGIYEFEGKTYKARWFANALKLPIGECKLICEAGYAEGHNKLPQAILVVSQARWEEIAKSYASWVGLTCFHFYDSTTNLGTVPTWLKSALPHRTPLIHEYTAGKVAFLREWNDIEIYRFFEDCAPPQPIQPIQPAPIPGTIPGGTIPIISLAGIKQIHGWFIDSSGSKREFEVNIKRE